MVRSVMVCSVLVRSVIVVGTMSSPRRQRQCHQCGTPRARRRCNNSCERREWVCWGSEHFGWGVGLKISSKKKGAGGCGGSQDYFWFSACRARHAQPLCKNRAHIWVQNIHLYFVISSRITTRECVISAVCGDSCHVAGTGARNKH